MEDLKQYRVDFKITYHCIGRKGLFRKKEYSFDWVHQYDMMRTTFYVNARNASRAVKKAKGIASKHANYLVDAIKKLPDGEFLTITGNTAPKGDFKWSPNVYGISGMEIELIKVSQCKVWREANIKDAMENLSVEEFKTVFGETIPQQEEN